MQSAQAEKDMKQMELQSKFLEYKQQNMENITGQMANLDLPNTQVGKEQDLPNTLRANGRDDAEWHACFVKNYLDMQK